jgi:hypothetical protein
LTSGRSGADRAPWHAGVIAVSLALYDSRFQLFNERAKKSVATKCWRLTLRDQVRYREKLARDIVHV